MDAGSHVEGLLTQNWRFVNSDLYGITERVIEYDKDARLGVHEDGHLGILRFCQIKDVCPAGTWIVAFNLDDPATEDGRWYGEPDGRVIEQMSRADLSKRDPIDAARKLKVLWQMEELRQLAEDREEAAIIAEETIFKYRKREGQKRRIYVP